MALDRRILSILYYNDIVDVNDVEKFIGEKNGYYIVVVNGETKKLKVPGFFYPEETDNEILDFEIEDENDESVNDFEKIVDAVKANNFIKTENEQKNQKDFTIPDFVDALPDLKR